MGEQNEQVKLYALTWGWTCPECDEWNETEAGCEPDNNEEVACCSCNAEFMHSKQN